VRAVMITIHDSEVDYQWPICFLTHKSIDFMILNKDHAIKSSFSEKN
jgi:hypothetical protein